MEGDLLPVDEVMRRASRNRAIAVTWQRAAAGVSNARHRYAVNLEVGGPGTDHFPAVRGAVP